MPRPVTQALRDASHLPRGAARALHRPPSGRPGPLDPAARPVPSTRTMSQATTLLTGATGFVGSAVARRLLAGGHQLRLLVRPNANRGNLAGLEAALVEGDLTDPVSLARACEGCRFLFHVAADYRLWVPDPAAMLRANVDGSVSLLRAAHAACVEKIVYCSSVAALGLTGDGTPADETTPVHPEKIAGIYKQSKYRAEQAVPATRVCRRSSLTRPRPWARATSSPRPREK